MSSIEIVPEPEDLVRLTPEMTEASLSSNFGGWLSNGTPPVTKDPSPETYTYTRGRSGKTSTGTCSNANRMDGSKVTSADISVAPPQSSIWEPPTTKPAVPTRSVPEINVCWECIEQGQSTMMEKYKRPSEEVEIYTSPRPSVWLELCFHESPAVNMTSVGPTCEHASRQWFATYEDCAAALLKRAVKSPALDRPQATDEKADEKAASSLDEPGPLQLSD